jgi:hypothetical protein
MTERPTRRITRTHRIFRENGGPDDPNPSRSLTAEPTAPPAQRILRENGGPDDPNPSGSVSAEPANVSAEPADGGAEPTGRHG